ncbi:hypothetical protein QQX98_000037 [Neonectria punicea]|uniref:Prion-inhibition and propagation HeLo domain-containing protein n=1 Tax=Neonectria punicea TaxID=979145 RepID=A0ABR1HV25_9HYPO
MSGIEVAGLVLGAFPLLITALEHYRDVAEASKVFWKIKREYKRWVHDLKICELAFERNLEFLLLPLIVDDDEVQGLLKDPGGHKWQDPELEVRLKERLLKSYHLYLESIGWIREIIEQIKEELGVDSLSFQTKISDDANLQQACMPPPWTPSLSWPLRN